MMRAQHDTRTSFFEWPCIRGPYYDCRLNKWGDKFLGCNKSCLKVGKIKWSKELLTQCKYEVLEQDDYGKGSKNHPEPGTVGFELAPFPPPLPEGEERILKDGDFLGGDETLDFVREPAHYQARKICCEKPKRKCFDLDSSKVAVRVLPPCIFLPEMEAQMTRGTNSYLVSSSSTGNHRSPRCIRLSKFF